MRDPDARDAANHLNGDVGEGGAGLQFVPDAEDERHRRVEVRAGQVPQR